MGALGSTASATRPANWPARSISASTAWARMTCSPSTPRMATSAMRIIHGDGPHWMLAAVIEPGSASPTTWWTSSRTGWVPSAK